MTKRGNLTYLLLPLAQAFLLAGLLPDVMQETANASSVYGPETVPPESLPPAAGPSHPGLKPGLRGPETSEGEAAGGAIEFYNIGLKHYFITTDPLEANAIDEFAAGPGWVRTEQSFKTGGPDLVCRFAGTPGVGPNSHFYSIDPNECESANADPGWKFEGYAFSAHRPGLDGACPVGTRAVKRLYNGRFEFNDSNHRFVTSDALYDEMLEQGWEGEGVALCAPQ